MARNGRSRFDGFMIGDRVALVRGAVDIHSRRRPLDQGTVGTVVGCLRGLPQVDFGDGLIVIVNPHQLELVELPHGMAVPDNGDSLYTWDMMVALMRAQMEGAL